MTVTKQPKYLLGGMAFRTKAAIAKHCKQIAKVCQREEGPEAMP